MGSSGNNTEIPTSCCRNMSSSLCGTRVEIGEEISDEVFFTQGCAPLVIKLAEEHFGYLICTALGLLMLELLGIVFSLCLCCVNRKMSDRKL